MGGVSNLIRNTNIFIRLTQKLMGYLSELAVVNQDKYFYTGKLMSKLFLDNSQTKEDLETKSQSAINDNLLDSLKYNFIKSSQSNRIKDFVHFPYFLECEILKMMKQGKSAGAKRILDEIRLLPKAALYKNLYAPLKTL